MKKMLLAATMAACAAGPAMAGDWTGFYIGGHAGLAGDQFEYPLVIDTASFDVNGSASINSSGLLFGAQGGYNHQMSNRWVVGAEADVSFTDLEGRVDLGGTASGGMSSVSLDAEAGSQVDYFGTIRGRVGRTYGSDDQFLPYITGGIAFGDVSSGFDIGLSSGGSPVISLSGEESSTQTGWTAGAGFEYRLGERSSFKTEYLYVDLGDYRLLDLSSAPNTITLDADTSFHVVRAGWNYRF